jgi:type IV secretion/conjugal transfer VirB4 family ATPase
MRIGAAYLSYRLLVVFSMSRRGGYQDLLPWGHLNDSGMVFTKNSQILIGYYFRPPDADSTTDDEADVLSDHINAALTSFGTGWASWSDVYSYPSDYYPDPSESHFPDEFSRAVDNERRKHFQAEGRHYENDRAFFLCYTPPAAHVSRLSDLFYTTDTGKKRPTQDRILEYFEDMVGRFENRVAGTIGLQRMRSFPVTDAEGFPARQDELVNYLNFCATGRVRGVMLPKAGAYLDLLISGQDVTPGENPMIGRDYIGVVQIDGIPAESRPNVIAALNTLAMPYRFSQRLIYLDAVDAKKEINRYRSRWSQKVRGIVQLAFPVSDGKVDEHAVAMKKEADTAHAWAESGTVKYGFYAACVLVRHPDPDVLKQRMDDIEEVIADCGFGARAETTNTIEAWRGSLPGDTRCNIRRPIIHTKTASDLMPLSAVWTGEDRCPNPLYPANAPALLWADTAGAIPFRLNLFIGPRGDEGGTIVLGPTGAGKSTLTNTIALQALRYHGMEITAFDYKEGMMATCLACRGRHYDLANDLDKEGMYSPLSNLDTETEIEWAADYLSALYELQTGERPGSDLRPAIYDGVLSVAAAPRHLRTMTNFVFSALQDRAARQVFEFYTLKGPAGRFLDGSSDPRDESHFLVYETRDLMSLGQETSLAVLLYLFRRFERSLKGQPAILFLAEAWQVFQHPIWRARLAKWLRELRSKNALAVMDTQSLADAVNSPMLSLLIESCKRKIFLPNPAAAQSSEDARAPGPKELYRQFGLNDRQIEIIRSAVRKREYYITGPDGCRKVALGLSELELAIAGATSEPEVLAVREMVQQRGDEWLPYYLSSKRIDYAVPLIERAYA